tara:strand:- start:742 stop:1377 length:636 start_codon:yes stop_codon:yes gene_type:complete
LIQNNDNNNEPNNIEIIQSDDYEDVNPVTYKKNSMIRRMIGAAFLNVNVYEEIEADKKATLQAVIVVILASFAAGIGAFSIYSVNPSILDLTLSSFTSLIRWAFLALITYFVGSVLLKTDETDVTWGELARTMGFAQTPAIIVSFGIFSDVLYRYITMIVTFWLIATMVVAVRQALDFKRGISGNIRAFIVVLLASIPGLLINYYILSLNA